MANLLKIQVIAEGVETKYQASFLLQQGCIEAQGYYFSKPVPVEEFVKKLIKQIGTYAKCICFLLFLKTIESGVQAETNEYH